MKPEDNLRSNFLPERRLLQIFHPQYWKEHCFIVPIVIISPMLRLRLTVVRPTCRRTRHSVVLADRRNVCHRSSHCKSGRCIGCNCIGNSTEKPGEDGWWISLWAKMVSEAAACWDKAISLYDVQELKNDIAVFNASNSLYKKEFLLCRSVSGISFTKILMNQARALVHVYMDGSVNLSTGVVEMGQGVNTKMLQVAATVFSDQSDKAKAQQYEYLSHCQYITICGQRYSRPLTVKAVQIACEQILERLKASAAEQLNCNVSAIEIKEEAVLVKWQTIRFIVEWTGAFYLKRVNLSEHGHYATPGIHFDNTIEKDILSHIMYGTAVTTVTGLYPRHLWNWCGKTGAWFRNNDESWSTVVRLKADWYKELAGWRWKRSYLMRKAGCEAMHCQPTRFPIYIQCPKSWIYISWETSNDNLAIFRSKAVGEPPLMYGIGTYFALRNAVKAFNPASDIGFAAPMTPEKVLMGLYSKKENK